MRVARKLEFPLQQGFPGKPPVCVLLFPQAPQAAVLPCCPVCRRGCEPGEAGEQGRGGSCP